MLLGEKYQLLQLIVQGKICGKGSRRKPKTSRLQNLREWFHYNFKELFSAAKDRDRQSHDGFQPSMEEEREEEEGLAETIRAPPHQSFFSVPFDS